eukprot:1051527-Rhodomonas_salina.1
MAWCRIAHVGGELAISVWIAVQLALVVEICHHKSRTEVRAHIMAKSTTYHCEIDHLQHRAVHNRSPG